MPLFKTNTATATTRRRPIGNAGRLYAVGTTIVIGMVVVAIRLFVLQVQQHGTYIEQARKQYESKVVLQSRRGPVYDRNGNLLVSTITATSFAVDPRSLEHPRDIANLFRRTLGGPINDYIKKVSDTSTSFVWLHRKLIGDLPDSLAAVQDNGLIVVKEPMRRAEYSSTGAQILGCTDIDNNGIGGIELFYNSVLKGVDGFMVMQRDARGRRYGDFDLPHEKPENGNSLVLTIDVTVQQILEDELRLGVEQANAASGTAVAIDPRTGEILGIAAFPGYNPNDLQSASTTAMRVRAITDAYEPGSTMKVVTAAAAIEEHKANPDDNIDCQNGAYQIGIHTVRDDHPAGVITIRQAFARSSNIAFAKIASRLQRNVFYKYVRDFGFGITTGIDLPGEARGTVKRPDEFTQETQQFMSFGYQLTVTPLQLVCAYSAIANNGVLMKPHLLKRRLDKDGVVLEEVRPVEVRRVVSQQTAATVRDLMVGVVENGTGREAHIEGLMIAGKTGTAQQLSNGSYSHAKHLASFVGFFPADNPKVALLVMLDDPKNGYYGGEVAAPVFRRIAKRITDINLESESPQPSVAGTSEPDTAAPVANTVRVPDLRGMSVLAACDVADRLGLRVAANSREGIVLTQRPAPGSFIATGKNMITVRALHNARLPVVPDLRGLSLRRALNLLNVCGLVPRIQGQGIVRVQDPPAGTSVKSASTVVIKCSSGSVPVAPDLPVARTVSNRVNHQGQ